MSVGRSMAKNTQLYGRNRKNFIYLAGKMEKSCAMMTTQPGLLPQFVGVGRPLRVQTNVAEPKEALRRGGGRGRELWKETLGNDDFR